MGEEKPNLKSLEPGRGHSRTPRLAALEQAIEAIAALLHLDAESTDPEALVETLAARLAHCDELKVQLALQEVDDIFDQRRFRPTAAQRLEVRERRSRTTNSPLFCLMIGIDQPPETDSGAPSLDFLLVQIARRLRFTLRQSDLLMRYHDEGFLLISNSESIDQTRAHAERVLQSVCGEPVEVGNQPFELSISIAIAECKDGMGSANELIRLAWETLQQAQARGRRQIAVSAPLESNPA